MSYCKFFEEDLLMSQELETLMVPESVCQDTAILEEKFKCKSAGGRLDNCLVLLHRDILEIRNSADGSKKFVNLSFVRSNYQVLENYSMKYRIDLRKFHNELSLYTDKLEIVQRWMEQLSKFCINYNFYTKYTLGNQIGKGAFGNVFAVTQNGGPEKLLAAKIFEKKNIKKMFKKLMIAEIQVLQLLDHENIIPIHEVHETAEEVVVVMELMKEGLLQDYVLSSQKISSQAIKSIMQQVLSGLAYMASMGVIHRDIKPSNILVESVDKLGGDRMPKIRIADMGLACFEGEEQFFDGAGTHGYMAPEVIQDNQIAEKAKLTHKLDVYSAGCLFYWLIVKRSPFKTSDDVDIIKANATGRISFDNMHINKFNKYGIELLKRMLEKNPKSRISAKDALKHPYFTEEEISSPLRMSSKVSFPSLKRPMQAPKNTSNMLAYRPKASARYISDNLPVSPDKKTKNRLRLKSID